MFDKQIVCGYLYTITKYGYPPKAENTLQYMDEMHKLWQFHNPFQIILIDDFLWQDPLKKAREEQRKNRANPI